jgi:hypothetical protein
VTVSKLEQPVEQYACRSSGGKNVMTSAATISGCVLMLSLLCAAETRFVPTSVQLEMKNVRLHVDEGIVLDVTKLRGTMVSRD